jgi:hypothetical protein
MTTSLAPAWDALIGTCTGNPATCKDCGDCGTDNDVTVWPVPVIRAGRKVRRREVLWASATYLTGGAS